MVTRCMESDTYPVLEGEKKKCSKLQIKAPVNGDNNYNCLKVVKFLVA